MGRGGGREVKKNIHPRVCVRENRMKPLEGTSFLGTRPLCLSSPGRQSENRIFNSACHERGSPGNNRNITRSLLGRRLKGKGKGVLGARETRGPRGGREGNACQETIVFLVFNIHQANVRILIGQTSKHVNHSLNTLIRLAEINITLLSS